MSRSDKIDQASSSVYVYLAFVLILTAFGYTSLRAASLSLTHDEVLTYRDHVQGSIAGIFTYDLPNRGNNHLLNTLLIKFFCALFGSSEFVIRIPALVGHVLYLTAIYGILSLFLKKHRLVLGLCLMIFHPYLLDFFSCARGYSLALGFLAWGLFFTFKKVRGENQQKDAQYGVSAAWILAVAVCSHLAFLYVFLTILLVLVVKELISFSREKPPIDLVLKKIVLTCFPPVLFLGIVYTGPVLKMLRLKEFYFGGSLGFWDDTVASLIQSSFYGRAYFPLSLAKVGYILIPILLLSSAFFLIKQYEKKKMLNDTDKYLLWTLFILVVTSLIIVSAHYGFHVKFVFYRTAIFYIPIFSLFILLFWDSLGDFERPILRILLNLFFYLFLCAFLVHFLSCANFRYFHTWKYDASTKEMMGDLMSMKGIEEWGEEKVNMGVSGALWPSVNYYMEKFGVNWLNKVHRYGPDGRFDVYYIQEQDKVMLRKYRLRVVNRYDLSDTTLAASQNPHEVP